MARTTPLTSSKRKAFLSAFSLTGSVAAAARRAKVTRTEHYRWLQDNEYRTEFESMRDNAVTLLEDEAVHRAMTGTERPVFYKGKKVGRYMEYSDGLLQMLLRAWAPKRYREQIQHDHGGTLDIIARLNAGRDRVAAGRAAAIARDAAANARTAQTPE